MTVRHMRIFLAVCENGCNMTRAAQALHMAQPAVSLAVKELEEYYGVVLFDRIGRHLQITQAGRRFEQHARGITAEFERMEKTMRDWDAFGQLRVGASITIGSQFLPYYVKAYYERNPGTKVSAQVGPSDELEQMLLDDRLDFALTEGAVHTPEFVVQEYMRDKLIAIGPVGRFAQGQLLTAEEFSRQDFLLREPGSGTRETFDRAAAQAGFAVEPVWQAMSTTALVHAVISGLGVAVLPWRMVAGAVRRGQVAVLRVQNMTFERSFYIIHHRDKYLTSSARAFIELCRTYASDYPMPDSVDLY